MFLQSRGWLCCLPYCTRHEDLYSKLEEKSSEPKQGIFYDGQIYDSYTFVNSLIKSATKSIVLIDNYVDETVLTMLDKREPGVDATIYILKIWERNGSHFP